MIRLLAFAIWLGLSCEVLAQFGTPRDLAFWGKRDTQLSPLTISPTLFRWFVSSDVAANVVVSNQWSDRIVGTNMWQMDSSKSPTNGPAGMRFDGTQFLTNNTTVGLDVGNITGCGGCDTFFFIFTPDGSAGNQNLFTDSTTANYGPVMNAAELQYAGTISGGPNAIGTLIAGSTNDVVIRFTATNTIWYTNGVLAVSNTTSPVMDSFPFGRIGIGGLGNYKGSVLEVGVWTNFLISASLAASLHRYATNTYHYSP